MLGKHSLLSKQAFINQQIQCLQTQYLISITTLFIGLEQCWYFYEQVQKYLGNIFFTCHPAKCSNRQICSFPTPCQTMFQSKDQSQTLQPPGKGRFELTWVNKPYDLNQLGHAHLLGSFWQIYNKSSQKFDKGKSWIGPKASLRAGFESNSSIQPFLNYLLSNSSCNVKVASDDCILTSILDDPEAQKVWKPA